MKRLLPILLAAVFVAIALLSNDRAEAMGDTAVLGENELKKIYADLVLDRASLPRSDLEISHFSASPDSIELPPGATPKFRIISSTQAKELGKQTVVADVLVNGMPVQRITLSGDLALHGEVVCAARLLSRRHIITANDLKLVRRDLNMLGPGIVNDPALAIGKEIKTSLQPGAVIYGRLLKEPEIVKRGDIVSILAATDSIRITVPGRIQNAGAKGDVVKVKNLMSRKEIYAKVIGPDTVQTEL